MENSFHSLYVRDKFLLIFSKGNNQKGKLFLQDGESFPKLQDVPQSHG